LTRGCALIYKNRLICFSKLKYSKGKVGIQLEKLYKVLMCFLGLSAGNILTPAMLLGMAENPIVFAMANPDPEIDYIWHSW
jgi:malate dehydrogenase (oxaloacetate-decarboxylating)(NADP+)